MSEIDGEGRRPAKKTGTAIWTPYGIAAAALGVLAVAAVALLATLWSGHRTAAAERDYQARVMQKATEWTGVLINLNANSVESSLGQLRDQTVGELNAEFDSAIEPYRAVIKTLQARANGQVDSVSIEALHNDLEPQPGQRPPAPVRLPPDLADRTDTVLVVATSTSEKAGNKPVTVRWNLRLGVSDIDGTLMISRLESIR